MRSMNLLDHVLKKKAYFRILSAGMPVGLTDIDVIILGMHAKADNPELLAAKALSLPVYSYPEYLYEATKEKTRVVIGGSHGKTALPP